MKTVLFSTLFLLMELDIDDTTYNSYRSGLLTREFDLACRGALQR